MEEEGEEQRCQLIIFQCKELYIYKVPPASTIGHRAELWGVDNWLQEVSMKITVEGEDCKIKLFDFKSGDLFAECPVPNPGIAPLTTAVDAVVDSSRYFVLKLEDSKTKRHAFIGIGFGTREQASDFNAAISEHLQFVRRAREAEQMQQEFRARQSEGGQSPSESSAHSELSLKPGETISLKIGKAGSVSKTPSSGFGAAVAGSLESGSSSTQLLSVRLPIPPPDPSKGSSEKGGDASSGDQKKDEWGDFVS